MHYELLVESKAGDQDAMLKLLDLFKPLLVKYSRKLDYDDAYSDLTLSFFEIINAIKIDSLVNRNDAVVVAYMGKAVKTHFIKLLKQKMSNQRAISFSQLETWQVPEESVPLYDGSEFSQLDLVEIKSVLTENEFLVFEQIFVLQHSATEIAQRLSTSRQAIGQAKKRALKRLEKYMLGHER